MNPSQPSNRIYDDSFVFETSKIWIDCQVILQVHTGGWFDFQGDWIAEFQIGFQLKQK